MLVAIKKLGIIDLFHQLKTTRWYFYAYFKERKDKQCEKKSLQPLESMKSWHKKPCQVKEGARKTNQRQKETVEYQQSMPVIKK